MGDGADDALHGYIKAGMPRGSKAGKACPICGKWSYTSNRCHPDQGMFCKGQAMSDVIKVGMYVLVGGGLFKVTKVIDDGFEFDCVNGAWSGDYRNGRVYIEGTQQYHTSEIISMVQPPADVQGYNAIIPWMRENR